MYSITSMKKAYVIFNIPAYNLSAMPAIANFIGDNIDNPLILALIMVL